MLKGVKQKQLYIMALLLPEHRGELKLCLQIFTSRVMHLEAQRIMVDLLCRTLTQIPDARRLKQKQLYTPAYVAVNLAIALPWRLAQAVVCKFSIAVSFTSRLREVGGVMLIGGSIYLQVQLSKSIRVCDGCCRVVLASRSGFLLASNEPAA